MVNPTLVIVEDDEEIRELILAFFRTRNFIVKAYASAKEFFEDLSSDELNPSVVISDLYMPEVDGIQLVRKLKELNCEVPVILLTAERSSERAIEAIEAGAYDFVLKPMNFPQLQVSVERALHFGGIREENRKLKAAISQQVLPSGIIGKSVGLKRAIDLARRIADSSANVFISGETGVGKEVIAKAVHSFGRRSNQPFIAINCSAIPENLLESELFGHAKGAFTGAVDKKVGLFEEAGEGTLFLDEVGDLSLPLQAKLLRTLQERKIRRIGENQDRPVKARIISATHKCLREEVREKRFREDLFFRLNVIPIHIPPLRERREDILPLAEYFLKRFTETNMKPISGFDKSAMEFLLKANWPGNVRELENAVERAVVLAQGNFIALEDLSFHVEEGQRPAPAAPVMEERLEVESYSPVARSFALDRMGNAFFVEFQDTLPTLSEVTDRYIQFALQKNAGAKDRTAKDLGIDRKTLYRKLSRNTAEASSLQ